MFYLKTLFTTESLHTGGLKYYDHGEDELFKNNIF